MCHCLTWPEYLSLNSSSWYCFTSLSLSLLTATFFCLIICATWARNTHARYGHGGACNTDKLGRLLCGVRPICRRHRIISLKKQKQKQIYNQAAFSNKVFILKSLFWFLLPLNSSSILKYGLFFNEFILISFAPKIKQCFETRFYFITFILICSTSSTK